MKLLDELEATAKKLESLSLDPPLPNLEPHSIRMEISGEHGRNKIEAWFDLINKCNPENILKLCAMVREAEKALEEISIDKIDYGLKGLVMDRRARTAREALKKLRGEI